MSDHLCITVRWIGDRFNGFIDGTEEVEWPPSPFRLFQAFIAGAQRYGLDGPKRNALTWIERQQVAPDVLAPRQPPTGTLFNHWVPDNDNLLNHRRGSIRRLRPVLLETTSMVHYVWQIDPSDQPPLAALDDLVSTLSSLGWATDQAYAVVSLASRQQLDAVLELSRFQPLEKTTSTNGSLRVPKPGSIRDLERVHAANRMATQNQAERRRKRWPRIFDRVLYASTERLVGRPYRLFKLQSIDGSRFRYPPRRLIHIAAMVRHLAIEAMKQDPPRDAPEGWVRSYVAGHANRNENEHRQLSYLPLPSIGRLYTDPGVRRVMIAAPLGDDVWLDHVVRRLAGARLEPLKGDEFGGGDPPLLVPVDRDNIVPLYTRAANTWATVTPIILPGHDDHKPEKTRKLIEAALAQSGVEQACEFEWSALSRFPKSLSAHKYDKDKRPAGYLRPSYLNSQTAVHLMLRFNDGVRVPGPLVIGAGRHCGLGLMAALDDED